MKLIAEEKFNIKGRGDVFVINLEKNNLPTTREELNLLSQEVEIEGIEYKVIGVEIMGTHISIGKSVGVLVKQLKN
jgi:hypothetical protein